MRKQLFGTAAVVVAFGVLVALLSGAFGHDAKPRPGGHVDGYFVAISAVDGRVLWHTTVPRVAYVAGPIAADGRRIDAITGVAPNRPCEASPSAMTLDARTGRVLDRSAPIGPPGNVVPTRALNFADHGNRYEIGRTAGVAVARAFDATTGALRWSTPLPDPHGDAFRLVATYASAVVARRVLYLAYAVDGRDAARCGGG